jgi:predicted DNA-binding protein
MTENFENLVLKHLKAIQDQLMAARDRDKELLMRMDKLEADLSQLAIWLEDCEDLKLAEQEMTELRAGRSRTYTLDEVEHELGLNMPHDKA